MKTNLGYKFKFLTKDELLISLDRLSRFKLPEESYFRVFSSIITKCLITPKLSKKDIEDLSGDELSKIVELIWNKSVENIFGAINKKNNINILYCIIIFPLYFTCQNINYLGYIFDL